MIARVLRAIGGLLLLYQLLDDAWDELFRSCMHICELGPDLPKVTRLSVSGRTGTTKANQLVSIQSVTLLCLTLYFVYILILIFILFIVSYLVYSSVV